MTIEPTPVVARSRITTLPPISLDQDRFEPLYEIQSVFAQHISIESACDALLPIVTRVLPVRTVVLLDTTQGVHRALQWVTTGIPGVELETARHHALQTLRYLARDDVGAASVSRVAALVGGVLEQATPRFVTLPLVVHGHVFGVFQLEGASFGERDLMFIDVLVNQLAIALDRHHVQLELQTTRLEAERAIRRLRDLQVISDAALEGATLDESLAAVLPAMCSMFGTDAAAVLLASADGKMLRLRSGVCLDDAPELDRSVAVGAGAAGRIAAGTTAMFFDDLDDVDGVMPALRSSGMRSLLGAPMHARNRMTGVVYVASRGGRMFAYDDLQLVEMVADRIGTIIDNAALYEQALAAIRSRDAVMAVVSHDLRNPLSTIQMCTELFPTDDPQLVKPITIIKRTVDVMVRLIADLRDIGSIEAGHLSIQTRPEASASLVREAIEGIQHAATEKSLRLVKMPARDLILDCDRVRIIQVLTNLLSNAIKFTPKFGSITLSMTEAGTGQVRFSVEDTGAGIAEADLPHVFDRYWQGKSTAHLGTGLGLAITKGIVDAHGGEISVESRLGQGTTFSFTLRLAPNEARASSRSQQPGEVARAGSRSRRPAAGATATRVLIVDDEPNALSALASLLEDEGFLVETAIDGLAALPKVRDFAPDVLVVDVEMPGLRGDDLVRKVREDRSELPVILMTGHDDHVIATARMELGTGYIAKPLDIDELVSAIHHAVSVLHGETARTGLASAPSQR